MTTETELAPFPPEHPALAGHFPGNPIVPGVLLLDAALHAMGAQTPVRIDNAKFLSVVRPGEALTLQVAPGERRQGFTVRAGERAVASASFTST